MSDNKHFVCQSLISIENLVPLSTNNLYNFSDSDGAIVKPIGYDWLLKIQLPTQKQ